MKTVFSYRRHTRRQALKMFMVAIGFPVVMAVMLALFGGDAIGRDQYYLVSALSCLVLVLIMAVFVIPDYRRNTVFSYRVTRRSIECIDPSGESYRIDLDQVKCLRQVKYASSSMIKEYIDTFDDHSYPIPLKYDLDQYRLINCLLSANPNIERCSAVTY